ncbi:MAG TPA: DnaJ C-terminal domain-containing protein [Bacillota bacterium]|nr:DnaJ C-terminal domain-containing protein [Bacillota bacterium]
MAVSYQDYYEILGVKRDATEKEIKTAYRKQARKWHPDLHSGQDKETAEQKIKQINEAYEVLKDKEKRARYDQLGSNWQNGQEFYPPPNMEGFQFYTGGPGGFAGGTGGFSDFFEILFGQQEVHFGGGGPFGQQSRSGRRARTAMAGQDMETELEITLEEAYKGTEKNLQFSDAGKRDGRGGSIAVKIPAGVRDGSRIRLKGQGGPSYSGGNPGDLYLRLRLKTHPIFKVEGSDVISELVLRPEQAVLGDQVPIPTMDGRVYLTIPKGTRNGRSLRLKGKGWPDKGGRGDQYVRITIDIDPVVSPEEEKLYRQIADLRENHL